MKNRIFGLTIAIALSMFAAGGGALWAQGMGVTGWSSPQGTATQGRIRSVADDFIRPDSYTSARIGNWFAMTSFASTNSVSLGYAKKLEKVYIGAYYGGTFWANITPFNYTEQDIPWPNAGDSTKTVPVYDNLNFTTPGPSNRIAVLIGVADMGFRLTFFTDHESFSKKDLRDSTGGGTNYKSYKQDFGSIRPQLAWSMTKNLTENGVKPYATLDLDFQRDSMKAELAAGDAGEYIGRSANIFEAVLQLGLGGYTFYTKEAFRLSADFEYRLTPRIYSNKYNYVDGGKNKAGKIKGLNDDGDLTENGYFSNLITPYLAAQWGDGPVALRTRLQLPMTITNAKVTPMELNGDKLEKDGVYTNTTTFGFNPSLQLALQWRPITKLAINAGGLIGLGNIGGTTVKSTTYVADKEQDNSATKRVNKTIPATVTNQLFLGATFNPTEYLFFEAVCGATASSTPIGGTGSNRISIFDTTNGLFSFGSILVGLKF